MTLISPGGWLFGGAGKVLAEGSFDPAVLRTEDGQSLLTSSVALSVDSSLAGPVLLFRFGFATDEMPQPGVIPDSFTVTLQDAENAAGAVLYVTADVWGAHWVPLTPGMLPMDAEAISRNEMSFPDFTPIFQQPTAWDVAAPVPMEFSGRSVLVRFDLFSNQDGMHSLGFYSDVAVVPEPEVWVLVMIGAVIFVLRRRSHP